MRSRRHRPELPARFGAESRIFSETARVYPIESYTLHLRVLNGGPEAPCRECGGRCCSNGGVNRSGLNAIRLEPCEIDRWVEKHGARGIRFTADGKMLLLYWYQCCFLTPKGLCAVHGDKPLGCSSWNCVKAINRDWEFRCIVPRSYPGLLELLVRTGWIPKNYLPKNTGLKAGVSTQEEVK